MTPIKNTHYDTSGGASPLCNPHPKSRSLRQRDFEIRLSCSPWEQGSGNEGDNLAKMGCTHFIELYQNNLSFIPIAFS